MTRIIPGLSICKHTDDLQPGMWFLCESAAYLEKALAMSPVGIISTADIVKNLPCRYITTNSPWQTWSDLCAMTYPKQPSFIAGITGTNGKTSTAYIAYMILSNLGLQAAYIGTNGISHNVDKVLDLRSSKLTTADAYDLHHNLHTLTEAGVTHLILEVSSSGLERKRVANIPLNVAVWTSFSQDHLDIHNNMEHYWNTKLEITKLIKNNGTFLINYQLEQQIVQTGVPYQIYNHKHIYTNPIYTSFMADNLQGAASIAELAGFSNAEIQNAIDQIHEPVPGRLELIEQNVIVDFAHNPDSLKRLLLGFRGQRIVLVFGCGGNRDHEKRKLMGEIASNYADYIIITDDNPRNENPDEIRKAIISGCARLGVYEKGYAAVSEVPSRRDAIRLGIKIAKDQGALCIIAGKGRETTQIYKDYTVDFSDIEEVKRYIGVQ